MTPCWHEEPPLTDAAAVTSYVTKNHVIEVTTKLVDTLYVAAFIVFLAGLRQLIRHALPHRRMLPSLVFGAGLTAALVTLAGDVLARGAALGTFSRPDPGAAAGVPLSLGQQRGGPCAPSVLLRRPEPEDLRNLDHRHGGRVGRVRYLSPRAGILMAQLGAF